MHELVRSMFKAKFPGAVHLPSLAGHGLPERMRSTAFSPWFMGAVAAHGLLDTDSLVARALVGMVQPLSNPSGTVHLPLSQEELANLAAVSRQTCNKAMTRFKNAGLVRTEYGGIVVLDLPGLNALSR